ncbi:MAG: YncE family protein [Candidatus Solibacter usitatus]|nr:YncE family protein [Candidatus Solibacter usitatus]
MRGFIPLVTFALAAAAGAGNGKLERRLYVTDKTGISVYDIDRGHQFLRKIDVPDTGAYKGIAASVPLGRLYLTSNTKDDLVCLDLGTDQILWRKKHGKYPDSMAITPDGKTLYVPYRDEDYWGVVRAEDGELTGKIHVGRGQNYDDHPIGSIGPHNTWMNPAGTRVYFEVLTLPWVFIADTATNRILGKVGPFSKGIRPFCVSDDEKYVYANVDWLLGFEIGAVKDGDKWGGKMLHRVEARTPPERLAQIPNPAARKPHSTMSHGINIRPDQKEVWVVDGVYGYVYAYDVTKLPPKLVAGVPLFKDPKEQPKPGWISFSLDGRYVYPDGGAVIDSKTKKVVARIPTSEKLIEIDFADGKVAVAGHR